MSWAKIPNHSRYEAHPNGLIRREDSKMVLKLNHDYTKKRNDYYRVWVTRDDGEKKLSAVHRLIAATFCPNNDPQNKKEVNHINGDKLCNSAENLEWMTRKENLQHAADNHLKFYKRQVRQLDYDGNEMAVYNSTRDAAKSVNKTDASIIYACQGKTQTCAGFKWEYVNDNRWHDLEEHVDWRDIPGFEGRYKIDPFARIFSVKRNIIIKARYQSGYYVIRLMQSDGQRPLKSIHRLVAQTFIPNPDNKKYVDHIDRNTHNNHVSNLRWVTASENVLNQDRSKRVKLSA